MNLHVNQIMELNLMLAEMHATGFPDVWKFH